MRKTTTVLSCLMTNSGGGGGGTVAESPPAFSPKSLLYSTGSEKTQQGGQEADY